MQVSSQLHAPAALPQGKEHSVPIEHVAWVGPRAGLNVVERTEIFAKPRIESRFLGRPACSLVIKPTILRYMVVDNYVTYLGSYD
jgi:hypothetical protein